MHKLYCLFNKLRCMLIKCKYGPIINFHNLIAKRIHIHNCGINNRIWIENNCEITNCRFLTLGNNNTITIESGTRMNGVTLWVEDDNNQIHIGKQCTFESGTELAVCEGTSITIGDDCMFSNNISVRTTDSHSILDSSGKRINPASNIRIGDHVWVGYHALILKGGIIDDNSIIASQTVVSSSSPHSANCIMAGIPATITKRDITWCRKRI